MSDINARVEKPTVVPPRPTMYALACVIHGKWTLAYAGMSREWIVGSQQPLHPGSSLVIVEGEQS